MITLERPLETIPEPEPEPKQEPEPERVQVKPRARGQRGLVSKATAGFLGVALLSTLSGTGHLSDPAGAFDVQARATALHARWIQMVGNGVPGSDLAELQAEWAYSQQTKFVGVGSVFWWPGGSAVMDRWQAQTDAQWAYELSLTRTSALIAEQGLHRVLGEEPRVQIKGRLDALAAAKTPADFARLRSDWSLETRLVPIDRRVAGFVGQLSDQSAQAAALGIISTPAADFLARADDYSSASASDRMAHAELLMRGLIATQKDLQARLDSANAAQRAFSHASAEIDLASIYGIDVSGYQGRVANNRGSYATATSATQFDLIAADLSQIAAAADGAIGAALGGTHIISGVVYYTQIHSLSCEETAVSMALTHQRIYLSQDQILNEMGADRRPMIRDANGVLRWGNPYINFVGDVNGSDYTGYLANYPPLVRVAQAHGAKIIAAGSMSASTIYARVIAGHPVVAYATWDWAWHPRHDYLSFDGQWIPWLGPTVPAHVYTVIGVSPSSVLVNDPIRGQYWVSKSAFQASYSDFGEAIVFA